MRALAMMTTALALGACVTKPILTGPDTGTPRRIAYATDPCFGACPVYALTLDTATGAGTFEGKRFTAVVGRRAFTATPAQSLAFSAAVEEVRRLPADAFQQGGARCRSMATDLPGVTLTWNGGGTAPVTRRVYFGCMDEGNHDLFAQLRAAPSALPVADLIGHR